MTNVFVSIDMEGIAGISTLQQVWRGSDDFPASRRLMTLEANAAVEGAFQGGASSVVVNDSHGDMYNLLPEELDPRAELLIGGPKVWSMMQGFGADFDIALFIGYHAAAGTEGAVLDHTYAGRLLYEVRLNGEAVTEAERTGPRTVRFETADFRQAFRCLLAWTYLGASEAPRYAGT